MHSDVLNYTKLAFNSLKMIQNDTIFSCLPIQIINSTVVHDLFYKDCMHINFWNNYYGLIIKR